MPILGSIIKGIIEFHDSITAPYDPVSSQREVLQYLLRTAKNTAFGREHGFSDMSMCPNIEEAFAEAVPICDYNAMQDQWWHRLQGGEKDVTWPGSPPYFALSSGTTGKTSKRIPVTDEMLLAIRNAGIKQVASLANFHLPAEFFEKQIMMLGSSTKLLESAGHLEGEISGISAGNIPFWFDGHYKPGKDIAKIEDWETRVQRIAELAPEWDIGALSGIPSWIELMLKKVIEHNHLTNIHEVWPNLEVYATGGVAFGPYEKSFNSLLGHPLTVIDTYLASEGFLAFQARPETQSMKLVTDNGIYFEFVPFKPEYILEDGSVKPGSPVVSLKNAVEGTEYVLVISTVAGAWRYVIGDTIQFTDVAKAEIRITGRTKFFLNVVGSQLSVNKMNDALKELEQYFNLAIPEFTVAAVRINGDYYHKWYLGTDDNANESALAEKLDECLKAANKNYAVARSKALKGVVVKTISPDLFYEWNSASKKKGDQVKMERVMDEEKFQKWERFIEQSLQAMRFPRFLRPTA